MEEMLLKAKSMLRTFEARDASKSSLQQDSLMNIIIPVSSVNIGIEYNRRSRLSKDARKSRASYDPYLREFCIDTLFEQAILQLQRLGELHSGSRQIGAVDTYVIYV